MGLSEELKNLTQTLEREPTSDNAVKLANCYQTVQGDNLQHYPHGRHFLMAIFYYQLALTYAHSDATSTEKIALARDALIQQACTGWLGLSGSTVGSTRNKRRRIGSDIADSVCQRLVKASKRDKALLVRFRQCFFLYLQRGDTQSVTLKIHQKMLAYIRDLINSTVALYHAFAKTKLNNYCFIGFGSMADGMLTPYSDIEFALLIDDLEQREHFIGLVQLLHLRILLLNETTPKIMLQGNQYEPRPAISSPVINGLSFDGAGNGGDKTPLGFKLVNDELLLLTRPESLVKLPQRLDHFSALFQQQYPTLALDIQHGCFICGTVSLFDRYSTQIRYACNPKEKVLKWLDRDSARFEPTGGPMRDGVQHPSMKHDWYRFPCLMLRHVLLYLRQLPLSVNQTLSKRIETLPEEYQQWQPLLQELLTLTIMANDWRNKIYLQAGRQTEVTLRNKSGQPLIPENINQHVQQRQLEIYYTLHAWLTAPNIAPQWQGDDTTLRGKMVQGIMLYHQGRVDEAIEQLSGVAQQVPIGNADGRAQQYYWIQLACRQLQMLSVSYHQLQGSYEQLKLRFDQLQQSNPNSLAYARCALSLAYLSQALGLKSGWQTYLKHAKPIISQRVGAYPWRPEARDLAYFEEIAQCSVLQNRYFGSQRLLHKLYSAMKKRFANDEMAQGLEHYYIPPDYCLSEQREALRTKNLLSAMQQKIENASQESGAQRLIVLGDSGSGKTLTLQKLEKTLWGEYATDNKLLFNRVPLYIPLRDLPDGLRLKQDCAVEYCLKKSYQLNDEEISELKQSEFKYVLLCDGYDELGTGLAKNALDNIIQWHKQTGCFIVLSCRTQYYRSQPLYRSLIQSTDILWYIAPFSANQIKKYRKAWLKHRNRQHQMKEYSSLFESHPQLASVAQTPLVLHLIMTVLPRIKNELATQTITRYKIYSEFIKDWFLREGQRYKHYILGVGDIELERGFEEFSANLALTMTRKKTQQATYDPANGNAKHSTWHSFFDPTNQPLKQQRVGCPLRRSGDYRYQFIHPSFRDYFCARALLQQLCLPDEFSSEQYQEKLARLQESDWNNIILRDEAQILGFMIEARPSQYRLLPLITASNRQGFQIYKIDCPDKRLQVAPYRDKQGNSTVAQVAGNAMTLFIYCGYSAAGMNLSSTHIKNADISKGLFRDSDLQDAKWEATTAIGVDFYQSDCLGSELDMDFGERERVLKNENYWLFSSVVMSKKGLLLTGNNNGEIDCWNLKNKDLVKTISPACDEAYARQKKSGSVLYHDNTFPNHIKIHNLITDQDGHFVYYTLDKCRVYRCEYNTGKLTLLYDATVQHKMHYKIYSIFLTNKCLYVILENKYVVILLSQPINMKWYDLNDCNGMFSYNGQHYLYCCNSYRSNEKRRSVYKINEAGLPILIQTSKQNFNYINCVAVMCNRLSEYESGVILFDVLSGQSISLDKCDDMQDVREIRCIARKENDLFFGVCDDATKHPIYQYSLEHQKIIQTYPGKGCSYNSLQIVENELIASNLDGSVSFFSLKTQSAVGDYQAPILFQTPCVLSQDCLLIGGGTPCLYKVSLYHSSYRLEPLNFPQLEKAGSYRDDVCMANSGQSAFIVKEIKVFYLENIHKRQIIDVTKLLCEAVMTIDNQVTENNFQVAKIQAMEEMVMQTQECKEAQQKPLIVVQANRGCYGEGFRIFTLDLKNNSNNKCVYEHHVDKDIGAFAYHHPWVACSGSDRDCHALPKLYSCVSSGWYSIVLINLETEESCYFNINGGSKNYSSQEGRIGQNMVDNHGYTSITQLSIQAEGDGQLNLLVSGDYEGFVCVWDVKKLQCIAKFDVKKQPSDGEDGAISWVQIHPKNPDWVLAICQQGQLVVYSLKENKIIKKQNWAAHKFAVVDLTLGRLVLLDNNDGLHYIAVPPGCYPSMEQSLPVWLPRWIIGGAKRERILPDQR